MVSNQSTMLTERKDVLISRMTLTTTVQGELLWLNDDNPASSHGELP